MSGSAAQPSTAPRGSSGRTVVPGQPGQPGQPDQSGQPGPAGGRPAPDAARAVAARRARGTVDAIRAALQGSTGRLRISGIVGVLACLAFAGLSGWGLQARANALSQARTHAAQLVRIQQIASDLVQADSQFTNGYLTFGLESPARLNSYDQAVSSASRLIAQAAEAEPADAAQLATVSDALTQYTALVATARANNRLGYQVGVGYLRQASAILQSSSSSPNLLPTLGRLATANTQRVDQAFAASGGATVRLAVAAVLGLGLLVLIQFLLALQTHRVFNLPLVAATVAVLLALAVGASAMTIAASRSTHVKRTSYAATLAVTQARIAAYVGKSYESITLIYIGTGGAYSTSQTSYLDQVAAARSRLGQLAATGTGDGRPQLAAWDSANAKVYQTALSNWITAAKQASAEGSGTVNARFTAFDDATRPVLDRQSAAVSSGLNSSHLLLIIGAWLCLVLGVFAAGAAWLGISLRLEEYR